MNAQERLLMMLAFRDVARRFKAWHAVDDLNRRINALVPLADAPPPIGIPDVDSSLSAEERAWIAKQIRETCELESWWISQAEPLGPPET